MHTEGRGARARVADDGEHSPFGRVPLLLDLGEDAVRLVVDAVRAGRQLAIALDLLLPAHVAGLSAGGQGGQHAGVAV